MRFGLSAILVILTASVWGCSTPTYCDSLAVCGGDVLVGAKDLGSGVPSTEWIAVATDACVDQVPNPVSPNSLLFIPPRPAGIRAVEPSTVDWCSGLVIQASDGTITEFDDGWYETLQKFDGWFPSIPLYNANLVLSQNNQYTLSLTQLASQRAQFSSTCLVAQGVSLTCDEVTPRLKAFVTDKLKTILGLTATVYNEACTPAAEGGCDCGYNVSLTTQVAGPWVASGTGITFFDADAAPPGQADYCSSAAGLELTGRKGTDLFNRAALKNMHFRAPTCSDGVSSKTLGETGIDCGGSCPNACPQ